MFLIDDTLVSDDILHEKFTCDLERCKGACCWEGDFGAPLEPGELKQIEEIYSEGLLDMDPSLKHWIESEGLFVKHPEREIMVTSLKRDGACVFLVRDAGGIGRCAFEQAYYNGKTDFIKPLSCHLYPIRINRNTTTGLEAINYDRWDICSPACNLGKKKKMPVFRFVKAALIRKYGPDYFEQLEAVYDDVSESERRDRSI